MGSIEIDSAAKLKTVYTSFAKEVVYFHVIEVKKRFPDLTSLLNDFNEISYSKLQELLLGNSSEFALDQRGKDWSNNTKEEYDLLVRRQGVETILKKINPENTLEFDPNFIVLDSLAGNGFINRVSKMILPKSRCPSFINADASFFMVKEALKDNLFSIWQNAENNIWLKNESVDAVIFAYGTHHILNRMQAVKEAYKILKKNRKIVIHDFEIGSSVDHWFKNVVNVYSTPHNCAHFTKNEMLLLFKDNGFKNISIELCEDPFFVTGESEQEAIQKLCLYVIRLYALKKLNNNVAKVISLLDDHFGVQLERIHEHKWLAKFIRHALLGYAMK